MDKPNFIEVYKGVFDSEFCDKAIYYFNVAEEVGMTLNRQDHDGAEKVAKEDLATFLPHYNLEHSDKKLMNTFTNVFWEQCYKQYAAKFDILNRFSTHQIYTMKIQKTLPGQGYHTWHAETDGPETSKRLLTWTVYLNDEFEAGETEFLYQHYRYKPSKGDCIIFPAGFTHVHRGNPPIGGDKYIITGWVEF